MSIFSNVTEQNLINLRNLAEQQKNQQIVKLKNTNLKQTHDKKLAENLSPITKKLEEINQSFEKLGELNEKPQPQNNIPHPSIEHTQPHQPIKNNEGVMFDTELEKTLKNVKNFNGFF